MRPTSVFVRQLAPVEGQRLKRLSKRAKHDATRQRAMILLASATLMSPAEIARMLLTDESHVRKVIHEFNERGLESLSPRYGGGRPRRITTADEQRIIAVAGARPDTLGVPCTRWSLRKLSEHLTGQGIEISRSHLARLLNAAGLSFQRTRSWKASPDPDYEAKASRILSLYAQPPADGAVVISFDEMGPVSLRPQHGRGWAPQGRPERHRATYSRRHGVRYLIGALDVHADYLRGRLRPRRDGATTLECMREIRLAYPAARRIYWISDNLSAHWTPAIRAFAEASNLELVPTPTYASYLNRIESHFGAISEFVVKNADYLDWDACAHAMAEHIRYRNQPERRAERIARRKTHLKLAA